MAFPFPKDHSKVTPVQDSLIRYIHSLIVAKHLHVGRPNKALSSYNISITSVNETFSYYYTNLLMQETASFFIETKTRLAKQNLETVQREDRQSTSFTGNNNYSHSSIYSENVQHEILQCKLRERQYNATRSMRLS